MAHDLFISHSSKDRQIADQICSALETEGIKCWIAPRDIHSGEIFPVAIAEAIANSKVMVLIFSENSNVSKDVANELILAMDESIKIIPFRIEDVKPKGAMRYYLTGAQWLEATTPPTAENLQSLVRAVNSLIVDLTPVPLTIDNSDPSNGQINKPYNFKFQATGGTAPYKFSITAGKLPGGLELDADGTLSGTPSEDGSFIFAVAVKDAAAATDNHVFTLVTEPAPVPLALDPTAPGVARVDSAYSFTFKATGGKSPYKYSITAGKQPPGLKLDAEGTLSGTPKKDGSYSFTVRVEDSKAAKDSCKYTFTTRAVAAIEDIPVEPKSKTEDQERLKTPAGVGISGAKLAAEEKAAEHKYSNKHADKKPVKRFLSQKKSVLKAMTILVALSLLYIPYNFFYGSADQPSDEIDGAEPVGDSIIALDDVWIFYQNLSDGGKLYKVRTDGSEKEKVNDDNSTDIVVLGDWVYYVNRGDGNKLYRIRTDGSARTRINDESSTNLSVQEGWIYYLATDPEAKEQSGMGGASKHLYRIRTDGSAQTKIADGHVINFSVIDEWIYYVTDQNIATLQRIRTDGSDNFGIEAGIDWRARYFITDEWIYFSISPGIAKIRTDGTGLTQILGDYAGEIVVFDDWIYYVNHVDNSNIYRIHVDETERIRVNNDSSGNLHIAGDWIYYINYNDGGKIYKIRTDGTERAKLTDDRTNVFNLALNQQ